MTWETRISGEIVHIWSGTGLPVPLWEARTHMGNRDENHRRMCQIYNRRTSRENLKRLLLENFQNGAQLLTLTYGPEVRAPGVALATRQLQDWIRAVRSALGHEFLYVRATEWKGRGNGHHVHRVVMGLSAATAATIAPLWEYGNVAMQKVQGEELAAVAEVMMAQAIEAENGPARQKHVWVPSLGMSRPGKRGH